MIWARGHFMKTSPSPILFTFFYLIDFFVEKKRKNYFFWVRSHSISESSNFDRNATTCNGLALVPQLLWQVWRWCIGYSSLESSKLYNRTSYSFWLIIFKINIIIFFKYRLLVFEYLWKLSMDLVLWQLVGIFEANQTIKIKTNIFCHK